LRKQKRMDVHFFLMNAISGVLEDSCPVSPYGKLRNFTGLGRAGRSMKLDSWQPFSPIAGL
jgi:hypothetical protein